MIKKLAVLFIALLITGTLNAQGLYKADQRLSDCFSQEYITQLENSNSELIPYYNYYLDNSYYVVDLKSVGKEVTGANIHTVLVSDNSGGKKYFSETSFSKEKFNPLKYHFNLSANSFTTYVWKEAGIAIVFYPLSHISADYKNYMKNK